MDQMISRAPSNADDADSIWLSINPFQQLVRDWQPAVSTLSYVFGSLESVMLGTMAKALL